jgi:hypothetical protein
VAKQACLVLGHTVAYLEVGINLRSGALERCNLIQLRDRDRILDPIKELLVGDNPNWRYSQAECIILVEWTETHHSVVLVPNRGKH